MYLIYVITYNRVTTLLLLAIIEGHCTGKRAKNAHHVHFCISKHFSYYTKHLSCKRTVLSTHLFYLQSNFIFLKKDFTPLLVFLLMNIDKSLDFAYILYVFIWTVQNSSKVKFKKRLLNIFSYFVLFI